VSSSTDEASNQALALAERLPDEDDPLGPLRAARDRGETSAPPSISLAGHRLIDADLAGLDLSGCDLSGADLSRANLTDARLVGTNLQGATLFRARLDGTEFMAANLQDADLSEAAGTRTGFGQTNLQGARLFDGKFAESSFTGANLRDADCRVADLQQARFRDANLRGTQLDRANLEEAELSGADVNGASFHDANLTSSTLRDVRGYSDANWVGVDIRNVNFCGAYLLRRHIMDENYIHEFRSQGPMYAAIHWVWSITSDCGRSLGRWCVFTALIAIAYAGLYTLVDIDYGSHPTAFSTLYFSVVTFTTLGYGDVLPASAGAQALVLSEVLLGYLSLGGALSIMANKLARRAG